MKLLLIVILLLVNACLHVHSHDIDYGCPEFTSNIHHGILKGPQDGSSVTLVCDENFELVGPASVYCTALGRWNDTLSECMANDKERFTPCHFERGNKKDDPLHQHCHWISTPSADYKWIEYTFVNDSVDYKSQYLPPYDSTIKSPSGTSLVLVGQSTKKLQKVSHDTSRLAEFISPLLPATAPTNEQLCFVFYFYAGRDDPSVTLQVFINGRIAWQNTLDATNVTKYQWTRHAIDLRNETKEFRITLAAEPLRYKPFQEVPGIAIDDLGLFLGEQNCNFSTASNGLKEKTTTANPTTYNTTLVSTTQTPVENPSTTVNSSDLSKEILTTETIVPQVVTNHIVNSSDLHNRTTSTSIISMVASAPILQTIASGIIDASSPILQTIASGIKQNENSSIGTDGNQGSNTSNAILNTVNTSIATPNAADKEIVYGLSVSLTVNLVVLIFLISTIVTLKILFCQEYEGEDIADDSENSNAENSSAEYRRCDISLQEMTEGVSVGVSGVHDD